MTNNSSSNHMDQVHTCCLPSTNSTSSSRQRSLDHQYLIRPSLSSTAHSSGDPIPFDPSSEIVVRHTTKLLKSRDSRTGRLIINQYMKGNELGRGVHGIVYIGKNMDKLIRTSPNINLITPTPSASIVTPQLDHLTSHQIPDSHPTSSHSNSSNYHDADPIHSNSWWTDEDYETVAIKVVRREPKGPKSLRRSQIQRQQEREAYASRSSSNPIPTSDHRGWTDPKGSIHSPSIGRLPLLKDVDDKLKKEIAIMKRLRHNHIVQLKEVIDDSKSKKVFMILEFMEGGQVLWQDPLTQTPLMTVEQARKTFRQVLLGLEYLHYQGIIHRDIKPANLLWTADRETVKISDFGVSHISGVLKRSASNHNLTANLLPDGLKDEPPQTTNSTDDKALRKTEGSPAFMAPELCCPFEATPAITPYETNALDYFTSRNSAGLTKPSTSVQQSEKTSLEQMSAISSRLISLPLPAKMFSPAERPVVGKAIDIWALGVTLFCLLFGRTPFNAPNEYELFNVIWNEPILIPDTMGIERQSLSFDPANRHLDGPVQRDSRELVDLLRKLLEKDPLKRITLEDVKIHPWVLNNLDNTQYWVHETAPVGGDAVYVTTEEVANFSRPRASLTTHKPLFGVKQSLRKAAIKLGLQHLSPKASRTKSKSISSGASCSPGTQLEHGLLSLSSRRSSFSPHSTISHSTTIDTVNLPPNLPPSDIISPASYTSNTNVAFQPSFRASSVWSSNSTPKSNINHPLSVRPTMHSHRPVSPAGSATPIAMRPDVSMVTALTSSHSCLSSTSSRSGSSQPNELSHFSALSVPSSSPNTPLFAPGLHHTIPTHHILLDPIGFPTNKANYRRSLPSSPASIQAAASLSRNSLAPPRPTSPAAFSEGECHAKLATPTWFRDALFSVRRRFTRSPSRRNSHQTNLSASDDLDRHTPNDRELISSSSQIDQVEPRRGSRNSGFLDELGNRSYGVGVGPPSAVFSSEAETRRSSHVSPLTRVETVDQEEEEVTAEEEEADYDDDDDDDDDALSENLHRPPLMYHDGTKWTYPSGQNEYSQEDGANGDKKGMVNSTAHEQRLGQPEGQGGTCLDFGKRIAEGAQTDQDIEHGLSGIELTPKIVTVNEGMRTTGAIEQRISHAPFTPTMTTTSSHFLGQSSNHHVPWSHPRLTFRPSSIEDDDRRRLEYLSSDDDEDEDTHGCSAESRWKSSSSISISSGSDNQDRQQRQFQPKEEREREDDEDDEADNTLQIQVKPRKRGCSKSDGS